MFHNWIKRLFQPKNSTFLKGQPLPRRAIGYRFRLEQLEDRLTPTGWVTVGSMNTDRCNASAALLGNGEVIEAGGYDPGTTSTAELYNPTTETWSYIASMNTGRGWATSTVLPNGEFLVAGGGSESGIYSSCELYNLSTNTWTYTGSMNTARYNAVGTLLNNGEYLVAGGEASSSNYLSSAELYNPSTGTWSYTGNMTTACAYVTATLLNNGEVLVAGGQNSSGELYTSELYNPSTGTWTNTGNLPNLSATATATLLNNGEVLVAGGDNPGVSIANSELFNPSTGVWTATGSMNTARGAATAVLLANGQVLVAGGEGSTGAWLTSSELYNPSTGTWTNTASMNISRDWATMMMLENDEVLVAGGEASSGLTISDAEVYEYQDDVAPTITSPASVTCTYGTPVSTSVVTLTDSPVPSTVTYTATGLPSWASLNSSTGVLSGTPTAATTTPLTITVTASNGVNPNGVSTFQLAVNPAPLIVSANSEFIFYGQAIPTLTASYSGFVNGDTPSSLSGTLSLNTNATSSSGVGIYYIIPSGLSSPNYSISFVNGSLIVTPASLTVSADSKSKVYGQANPTLTASYNGFVNGDTTSSLSGTLSLNTSATTSSGVGSYDIVPSGLSSSNYSISFVNGTLTITQAPLTVSADSKSKVYGQSNPTLTASYAGFVNGDTVGSLSGTLSLNTTATTSSGAGSYDIVPSGLNDANYSISFVNGTLTVTPAPLTISANSESKVYGQALPTLTASYAGFVNGDTSSSLTGTLSLNTTATASSSVGSYDIIPSGLSSSNYSISFVNGTLTITQAPLTVSADSKSKVYGQPNPTLTASYAGFVNEDTVGSLFGTLSLNTTATTSSGAGSYDIIASGLSSPNYSISFVNGSLAITQAPLTVSADSKSKVYGQSNPTLTASFAGFVNGDTVSSLTGTLSLNTSATSGSGVGSYDIIPSGLSSPNYSISFVNGSLIVTPAPLTISANSDSMVYGQALPTLTASYAGFVNGDTVGSLSGSLSLNTTATSSSGVGSYDIVPSGLNDANYSISFVNGSLAITQAPLTVSADSKSKVYGQSNPTLTASYAGFVNGDTVSSLTGTLSLNTTATTSSGAGSYDIIASGLSSPNYSISFVNGTLTVTPAPLTVSADGMVSVYGQAIPTLTASYSGFVNGDTASSLSGNLSLSSPATTGSPAGDYPITASGLSSTNYNINYVNGTLTITPASLTVVADNKTSTYSQAVPTLTASYSGFVNGDTASSLSGNLSLNTPATTGSPAGDYPITVSGLSSTNYTIDYVNGTLMITPAPLTVSADGKFKVYGQANPTLTASYSGFVNGDTAASLSGSLSLSTSATIESSAGDYPITASGLSSDNYTINYLNGTLTVSPAPLTVTADDMTKLVGQANPTFTASYNGFVNDDTAGNLDGTLSFSTPATINSGVGTYPITPSGVTSQNYSIQFVNGRITIATSTSNSQTITFTPLVDPVTFGVGPIALNATATSNLPVSFSVVSGPGSVTGNTLTVTGAGDIVVEASQAGNGQYSDAPPVQQTLVVGKATDSITLGAIPVVPLGVHPFALNAAGSGSSSPVVYTVLIGPGSVSGNTLTVNALGTVLIEATQSGDANYNAATPVFQTVQVEKAQTITFKQPAAAVTYGVKPITLSATASSKLPVTYSVVSGPGTIIGNKLTVTGAGNIVIAANQAGNGTYAAAPVVERTIVVNKATLTVTAKNTIWTAGKSGQLLAGFTISGFVDGDTLAALFGSEAAFVTCPTVNANDPAAKTYVILISQGSLATLANYKFSFKTGILTVKG